MRVLKYTIIIVLIALFHVYFYQNSLILLIDTRIYDILSIYYGDEINTNNTIFIQTNLMVSLIGSIITLFLISKRKYICLFLFSLISFGISLIWLEYSSTQHLYVHIAYLWIPYANTFLFISVLAVLINATEQKKQKVSLEKSHEAALINMIHVVNIHDKETGEHLIRTKEYARTLAQYLYEHHLYEEIINKEFVSNIYKTAPLHDIGKVGIPDIILKKPGKFTEEEFKVMKNHPTLGREIVLNSIKFYSENSLLSMAHDIVYYHHEKWDGTGYPSKLKGEEIPLSGQIMALADVYDALVSKRRYKEPFSYAKADAIIVAAREKTFNPILIDAFLEVKEKFHEISETWREEKEKN